jgi:hypothetical protein
MLFEVPGINQGHDGIDHKLLFQIVVKEKGLRNRAWVSHARGLNQNVLESITALEQLPQYANQIAAHRATNAAIAGFEDFFFGANDQLMIHTHFAKFILDNRNALAMIFGKYAIEQCGLARSEKAG